jgi:hypothetical protein
VAFCSPTQQLLGGKMQSQINPDAPIKEYTGVWIPADVMECEELSPMEKILYGEIAGFRECYASNAWLANRIGRTERTVRRMISHLIELGFVPEKDKMMFIVTTNIEETIKTITN